MTRRIFAVDSARRHMYPSGTEINVVIIIIIMALFIIGKMIWKIWGMLGVISDQLSRIISTLETLSNKK